MMRGAHRDSDPWLLPRAIATGRRLWQGAAMSRLQVIALTAVMAQLAPACGDDRPSEASCADFAAPDAGAAVPQEVADVLERHCWSCHGQPVANYAPLELVDWADFQACRSADQQVPVYERMRLRINDQHAPMPPILQPRMPDEDRMILDTWALDGAPAAK